MAKSTFEFLQGTPNEKTKTMYSIVSLLSPEDFTRNTAKLHWAQ